MAAWGWGFARGRSGPCPDGDLPRSGLRRRSRSPAAWAGRTSCRRPSTRPARSARSSVATAGRTSTRTSGSLLIPRAGRPAEIADIIGTLAWHLRPHRRLPASARARCHHLLATAGPKSRRQPPHEVAFNAVALFRWPAGSRSGRCSGASTPRSTTAGHHLPPHAAVRDRRVPQRGGRPGCRRRPLIDELDRSQATRGDTAFPRPRALDRRDPRRRGRFGPCPRTAGGLRPVAGPAEPRPTYEAWAGLIAEEGAWAEAPRIVRRLGSGRQWRAAGPAGVCRSARGPHAGRDRRPERGVERLVAARDTLGGPRGGLGSSAAPRLALAEALSPRGPRDEAAAAEQTTIERWTRLRSSSGRATARASRMSSSSRETGPLSRPRRRKHRHSLEVTSSISRAAPALKHPIRQMLPADPEVVPGVSRPTSGIREQGAYVADGVGRDGTRRSRRT